MHYNGIIINILLCIIMYYFIMYYYVLLCIICDYDDIIYKKMNNIDLL